MGTKKLSDRKRDQNTYALIYFRDKKTLKRRYDTAAKAFYDFEDQGCYLVELFDERNIRLSARKDSSLDWTTIEILKKHTQTGMK